MAHLSEEADESTRPSSAVGNGTVDPDGGTFVAGTTVELTATADPGWVFDHWSGEASGTENPLPLLMDANKYVIAYFIETTPTVPNSSKLTVTSRLLNADGTPVGNDLPVQRDIIARLFNQELGGDLLFTETFLETNNQAAIVDRGFFAIRLGEGTTSDDLSTVLSDNNNLWVELSVGEVNFPQRIPLTSAPYTIR